MNQWLIGGGVALGVCILAAVVVTSVVLTHKSPGIRKSILLISTSVLL